MMIDENQFQYLGAVVAALEDRAIELLSQALEWPHYNISTEDATRQLEVVSELMTLSLLLVPDFSPVYRGKIPSRRIRARSLSRALEETIKWREANDFVTEVEQHEA